MQYVTGADNQFRYSPNESGIKTWQVKIRFKKYKHKYSLKTTHQSSKCYFFPLTNSSSPDPKLFSDLASENR
jgi:hypothetical protein